MMTKPKLYVLDDDAQYASLLVEVAKGAGWLATSEQSPTSFLACDLPRNGILVLDLNMPEMDGIEVIRALAKQQVDLLLILVSGFDSRVLHSAQQLAEAHNIKVLASLTKPIAIDEFTQVLSRFSLDADSDKKVVARQTPVLVEELQEAISQHQLVLHYQPQIDIKTGVLKGVEALVRWQHPERGMIYPDQFIELAEKNALINPLTDEIINIAVAQSQRWHAVEFDVVISINVSSSNITSLSLPEQLKKLTDKHAIDPEKITLEITESAVMTDLTSSLDVLNRLRMKGFSLSIDDFGTGYSSLTQLYQAPFTELKIDQHFISRMIKDTEAMVIVKICIMLGRMLGMRLVAEGVETQEIWNKLKELDCEIAQGYFISRPMPPEDLLKWKKSHE